MLYNAFVLYYDVIQMRYTIAVMLVLLSLYYIVEKRMVKAIFCGVLSLFFHRLVSIGIIFAILVYIIKPRADYKLRFKENAVIVLSGVGGIVFSKAIVSFIAIWIPFFQRINLYMTRYKSYDSLIIWAGYEAFILVVLYCLAYKRYISDNRIAATNKVVINTLYRFMFYGIAISGILLYVEEFNRIYRLFYLVGYMVYGMIEPQFCKKNNRSVVFWVLLFGSVVFMFVAIYRGLNFDLYW